ncbi:MAG TPA: KTSC domain-containing protein [Usitatibacter sp.]|jgi:hypothetical protein|nr:KTSC domain-containing protein [Usitatibacter sp.]
MTMEMKRLNGAGLKSAGYDERSRKMVVETTSGTFEYANVSPEIYRRLMSSPTPASYYRETIEEDFTARRVK